MSIVRVWENTGQNVNLRLDLAGEAAAGIAHEIRNRLTSVRGFLQLFGGYSEYNEYHKYLEMIIEELDRASAFISECLLMDPNKRTDLEPNDLNDIVSTEIPVIETHALCCRKSVSVELGKVPLCRIDSQTFARLLHHLAINGLEAMGPGGVLAIRTYFKNHVYLEVKDTGPGIDPLILESFGAPFKTTKERGKGMGIPICLSIASRHNALFRVDTGPGGTTISVGLPVSRSTSSV